MFILSLMSFSILKSFQTLPANIGLSQRRDNVYAIFVAVHHFSLLSPLIRKETFNI